MRTSWRSCAGVLLAAASYLAGGRTAHGNEPTKSTASASESNPAVPAAGHSVHGEAFDDGPRRAASLMPGMGKVHFPVSSSKPDAQAFVDQGVAQLHSFFYLEAERSFRQAAKIDPTCAMAYWGMAMANVNTAKRARSFLKDARKRDGSLTRREKLYIDALEALHQDSGSEATRKRAHLKGLETLVQEFPGDINARAWLAMVVWQVGSLTSRQVVDLTIDSVLQSEPMHPGAHHYRIHLWDGEKPARAEKSAAFYGKSAPGIAHAWHMPGHTYTEMKRYADAAYQQEASARVDHSYMNRERVMPFEIHNYAHNNQWLVTSLSHVGRARDAIAVARNLVEQPRDPNKNGKNDDGSAQRSGRIRWVEVLNRYELWDDLISASNSGALDWSGLPIERVQKAYNLGLAYAAKGDRAGLEEQVASLKSAPKSSGAEPALAELEGHQLLAQSEFGPAFERFARATLMRPEALARAHLKARNYGLAESTAKAAVDKQPNQIVPLATQAMVLLAAGKNREARDVYRKLVPLAQNADRDVPVFRTLAPAIAAWKSDDSWSTMAESATGQVSAGRVDPSTLGPLTWVPFSAEPLTGVDTAGKEWNLAGHKGRNVVILFFLGGKCPHCMQQLQAFAKEADALKSLDTDVVAVSTDDAKAARELKENQEGVKFPMPMLADPELLEFKRYHAYDDFEEAALHGTFIIDVKGNVRFQYVSAEPFLDVNFIKAETARITRLQNRSTALTARP